MAEWIEPVYDRKIDDVENAKIRINNRKSKIQSLNEDLKGCINLSDINRIEGNIEYISDSLNEIGYDTHCNTKQWVLTDSFMIDDFDRIINNLTELYTALELTPKVQIPIRLRTHNDVNNLERLTLDLYLYMSNIKSNYLIAGTFTAGQYDNTVPKPLEGAE